jgi:uncharacterized protein (TIGR03083 family)
MATKDLFIESIQKDSSKVVEAVRAHSAPPILAVPSCPGWNLTFLLLHLGSSQRRVTKLLRVGGEGQPADLRDTGFLNLEPEWHQWLNNGKAPDDMPVPPALVTWFEEGSKELVAALNEAGDDTQVWNFTGKARIPASVYQRQMATETTLHRWDAQNSLPDSSPDPVDPDVAYNAITLLFNFLPRLRQNFQGPEGQGETYHLHRTDGEGEWLLTFKGKDLDIKPIHAKGDVAIRGSASDLLLLLWRRIPLDRLEVIGDKAKAAHFFELLPKM